MSQEKLDALKNAAIEAEGVVENSKAQVAALESAEEVDKAALKTAKADLRKAESALKKANTAVTKEEARMEKLAEKEAAKAKKDAEKAEKAAAKQAEKEAKAAEREANRMPTQNDVVRPKPTTISGKIWGYADELSAELNQPVPVASLLEKCEAEGIKAPTIKTQYARWRKFHGVEGRISLPKAETTEEA